MATDRTPNSPALSSGGTSDATARSPLTEEREALSLTVAEAVRNVAGLAEVEAIVLGACRADAALLTDISTYLLGLGGKRVRPALALLSGRAFGGSSPSPALLDVAAGIELIHMATLLHDDIIDDSPVRRHRPSPYARYGVAPTLLTGDFLLVRAFGLCAKLDDFIVAATERACVELTEGEISETPLHESPHTLETALGISRKKTAALFRLATESAAHLAGLPDDGVAHAAAFGEKLGIAFQILDDVLDVTSDDDLLGKKSGTDLRERKPSVVNVLWLATGSPLAAGLRRPPSDDDEAYVTASLAELRGSEAVASARALAARYATEAESALTECLATATDTLEDGVAGLRALVGYTLDRVR